ncbi:unnamed protein product [Candidula unifasciata]|uniref:Uncharacterized protein n=1 Tax=Candidula unifasciata TaxID=100452 RepID=A0A8S3ZVI3_9EUPU|nr:unnamed protein product [Candidula unifasciata]
MKSCFLVALMTTAIASPLQRFEELNYPTLEDYFGLNSGIMVDPIDWVQNYRENALKELIDLWNRNNSINSGLNAYYAPDTDGGYTNEAVGTQTSYPDNIIQEYE